MWTYGHCDLQTNLAQRAELVKIIPEGALTDTKTTLYALILSLSSLTRVPSETSAGCFIFFNILVKIIKKKSLFLVKFYLKLDLVALT